MSVTSLAWPLNTQVMSTNTTLLGDGDNLNQMDVRIVTELWRNYWALELYIKVDTFKLSTLKVGLCISLTKTKLTFLIFTKIP